MRSVFLDPEITLAIDPRVLRALLRVHGAPRGLAPTARALFGVECADPLASALEDTARFGTDAGRRALLEAAHAVGRATAQWPLDDAPADFAARLVTARAGDATLAAIFTRARLRLARSMPPQLAYDVLALAPRARAAASRLLPAMRAWLGDEVFVDLYAHEAEDGALHVALLYLAAPIAVCAGPRAARSVHRPLRVDRLTYDPDAARLSVTTGQPERLWACVATFAEALWKDAAYFSDRPSFTCKPLQRGGSATLRDAKLPPGIVRATVVGCQVDSGEDARIESRGGDALGALETRVRVEGGYFRRAVIRFDVRDSPFPVDVVMQLPHQITVSDGRFARLARAGIAALGLFAPGTLPDDAHTLAPFAHPEWRWRELAGDAGFEALRKTKLLTKKRGRGVTSAEYRRLGFSYVAHEIPGERRRVRYALSEDLSVPGCDVREDALELWTLDADALAAKMRRELGAAPSGKAVAGIVDLGVVKLASATLWFLYAMRAPEKDLARRIVDACKAGVQPVILVPAGRHVSDGLREVELTLLQQLGVEGIGKVLGVIAEALDVAGEVEPWRVAEEPVVIDQATRRVWICGVLMTALAERSYRMLECLALRAGELVPAKEVGAYIAGPRSSFLQIARQTRPDLLKRIAASFAAAGVEPPAGLIEGLVVVEGKRGYRLGVGARVI